MIAHKPGRRSGGINMYTLIHYARTSVKGKYKEICRNTYNNKWKAYDEGRAIFDMSQDPNYAGFIIKDKDGNTLTRQYKKEA